MSSILNSDIKDFLVFNKRVIILTDNNHILVFNNKLKILQRKFLGDEFGQNIAICDRNEYLFVSESDGMGNSPAIRVLKIDRNLELMNVFSTKGMQLRNFSVFSFSDYIGNSIIISAIPVSWEPPALLMTFQYKIEENKVVELSDLREELWMGYVAKLSKKRDGDIVGVSWDDKLLCFNYKGLK